MPTLDIAAAPPGTPAALREARLRGMVDGHFDTVWRALKRLGVPESGADDAAQQVFLVASRRLAEIDPAGERAYLLGVALRVAADARRTLRRRREVPLEDDDTLHASPADPVPAPAPEEVLDDKRARLALAEHLARMPDEMREAFVLFELEEMSAPEVAAILGVPVGTVASRVRRARDHIRQRLGHLRGGT